MGYLFFTCMLNVIFAYHTNLTLRIDAGQAGCFYHNVSYHEVIFVEYNVIDSTLGDLYLNFHLADPEGEMIVSDFMRSENEHTYTAIDEGLYRFCFDNTITSYNDKTVSFEIRIKPKELKKNDHDDDTEEVKLGEGEDTYIMKLHDICESIARIQNHIDTAQELQYLQSERGARDKYLMEEMRNRVSSWSKLLIILMILLGFVQVSIVKNLFTDRTMKSCKPDQKITAT